MVDAALSLDEILLALKGVQRAGSNYKAQCPAHEDRTASLSVTKGNSGAILLKCFAGCSYKDIIGALGFSAKQLFPPSSTQPPAKKTLVATYDYKDAAGELRYQVCRMAPKDFRQRRPDGNGGWIWNMQGVARIPYRLNELIGHQTIYIAEGEKDVDSLWTVGCAATTNVGGAGKWKDSDSDALVAVGVKRVILLPDNDDPGRDHMTMVARSVKAAGLALVVVSLSGLPLKGDISTWFAGGHDRADLEKLVGAKPYVLAKGGSIMTDDEDPNVSDPYGAAVWKQTDLGVAESFVHRFGDKVRYNHKHKEWLVWNCHHWRNDRNEEIRRKATEHVRLWQTEAMSIRDMDTKRSVATFTLRLEKSAALGTLVDLSRAMLPISDTGDNWDADPMLVGSPNGVIDLSTGELRPGTPNDRITLQTSEDFDINAPCERWQTFVNEIFDNDAELISFIHRAVGYSLTADTREQCFFMCVGHGANGKSTFLSALSAVFGDYGYTTDTNVFASNAGSKDSTPYDLAELLGRRMVLMSETKANSRMNEQAIKNFTGGERINAQKKFGHPFEFQPVGKLWMGINHQPKVIDDSHGFWRRVRLIPFTRTFSGSQDNRNLKQELMAEAPGILAWAVRGCREWLAQGLNPPASVMKATDAYQESEDPILDFILERVEVELAHEVPCNGTYLSYKEWARDQGMSEKETLTKNSFGRLMTKRFERKHTMTGWRYVGLRLKVRPKDMFSSLE
jgi:putative DNA primase/helicase